jgi:Ca2+-binding RTX toxin-like protein
MGAFSNYGKVSGYSSTPKLQVEEVDFGYADNPSEIVDLDPWYTDQSYTGSRGNDWYSGRGGNDMIWGMNGHDTLFGASGNDTIYGGAGRDSLYGEDGDDILDSGSGIDHLDGGDGHDSLYGGYGHDTLEGGDGYDQLYGGDGDDTLSGGNGEDYVNGGDGNDVIAGGGSYSQDAQDYLTGGSGSDTFVFAPGDAQVDIFTFVTNTQGYAADTITDFDAATDFISGFGDAGNYKEVATHAIDPLTVITDPYFMDGDKQGTIFFYNEATDTGYLYHNSEVIVLEGCGSADDFSEANLV